MTTSDPMPEHQDGFDDYMARVQARFDLISKPIFRTTAATMRGTAESLFDDVYLPCFENRQYHACGACRAFFRRYGDLVTLEDDGTLRSVFFDEREAPEDFRAAIAAVQNVVERARVTGPFYTEDGVLGMPVTTTPVRWTHFAVTVPRARRYTAKVPRAHEAEAARIVEHGVVSRALADFTESHLEKAVMLLRSDALSRSEHFLAPAEWLLALARDRRPNAVWMAVATAPAGYCHPRSGMLGTLLDDVASGKSADEIKRAFAAKMHPLRYQRPQAPPSEGAIAQAEKLVAELGLERAFERRFARLDEVVALWKPKAADEPKKDGFFAHLRARSRDERLAVDMGAISWAKFARTVLPTATEISALVPASGNFIGLATSVHADAPALLKWDADGARNPVSWYLYHPSSTASRWGLAAGTWVCVTAICELPCHWMRRCPGEDDRKILLLEGARDADCNSLVLFPECIRGELHGVRSVIEAHSKRGKLAGAKDGSANGILAVGTTIRVGVPGGTQTYRIDRME